MIVSAQAGHPHNSPQCVNNCTLASPLDPGECVPYLGVLGETRTLTEWTVVVSMLLSLMLYHSGFCPRVKMAWFALQGLDLPTWRELKGMLSSDLAAWKLLLDEDVNLPESVRNFANEALWKFYQKQRQEKSDFMRAGSEIHRACATAGVMVLNMVVLEQQFRSVASSVGKDACPWIKRLVRGAQITQLVMFIIAGLFGFACIMAWRSAAPDMLKTHKRWVEAVQMFETQHANNVSESKTPSEMEDVNYVTEFRAPSEMDEYLKKMSHEFWKWMDWLLDMAVANAVVWMVISDSHMEPGFVWNLLQATIIFAASLSYNIVVEFVRGISRLRWTSVPPRVRGLDMEYAGGAGGEGPNPSVNNDDGEASASTIANREVNM